jgi:mannose-6-phosphate isomerase-like protein (cupin superfamily)
VWEARKDKPMNEDVADKAFGLNEGEGDARWWLGGLVTVKATGKETDGRYALLEVLDPEGPQPLHVHHREDEGFWILEGEVIFEVGDETIKASPGSFVFGPKDVPHRYTVESGPARILFVISPAGFEELIYATSEPARVHPTRPTWSSYTPFVVITESNFPVSGPLPGGGRARSPSQCYSPNLVEGAFSEARLQDSAYSLLESSDRACSRHRES